MGATTATPRWSIMSTPIGHNDVPYVPGSPRIDTRRGFHTREAGHLRSMGLAIRHMTMDGTGILDLAGDLDIATTSRFRSAADAAALTTPRLVVDLRNVDFMDSSGLGELLRLAKPSDAGIVRRVALVVEDERYAKLLELARLTDRFLLARDVSEAVTAVREAHADARFEPSRTDRRAPGRAS